MLIATFTRDLPTCGRRVRGAFYACDLATASPHGSRRRTHLVDEDAEATRRHGREHRTSQCGEGPEFESTAVGLRGSALDYYAVPNARHTRAHTGTRAHARARVMSPDAAKRQHFDPYFALRSTADFARDPSPRPRNSVPCPPSSLVPPSSFLPRSLPLSPVSVLPSSLPFIFHPPFSHSFMKPCARHCVAREEDRCEQDNHLRGSFLKPGLTTLRAWRPAGR